MKVPFVVVFACLLVIEKVHEYVVAELIGWTKALEYVFLRDSTTSVHRS